MWPMTGTVWCFVSRRTRVSSWCWSKATAKYHSSPIRKRDGVCVFVSGSHSTSKAELHHPHQHPKLTPWHLLHPNTLTHLRWHPQTQTALFYSPPNTHTGHVNRAQGKRNWAEDGQMEYTALLVQCGVYLTR